MTQFLDGLAALDAKAPHANKAEIGEITPQVKRWPVFKSQILPQKSWKNNAPGKAPPLTSRKLAVFWAHRFRRATPISSKEVGVCVGPKKRRIVRFGALAGIKRNEIPNRTLAPPVH